MGLTPADDPAQWEPLRPLRLRDGATVWVRPLRPDDRDLIATWYETLSPDTKRHRFLAEEERLTPRMLDYLVDGVDGADHVAMVVLTEPAPDARNDGLRLVGVARLVRLDADPTVADIAVTIDDGWHGRGLATTLLPVLLADRPTGVTHLHTSVARDNLASLAMLRRVGKLRSVGSERGVVEVEVELTTP